MSKHKRSKKHKKTKKHIIEEQKAVERHSRIDFLFISLLFLIIFLTNLPLANMELLSPDASGYLDMGRNLISGKGAVISSNIYQFWPEKYHPSFPYMQPLFPIIAGLIWSLINLKVVIGFNILLFAINCIFLYKILTLYVDYLISFLIAVFVGFTNTIVYTAIHPWTEQLHLFFLLLAIFIYLKYKKALFWVGMLLGISFLVKVASFYNIFAFGIALVVLRGFSKTALREYIEVTFGFLIIFLFYEMFCYFKYGVFYPEYLTAAKTYTTAKIAPGAFYKKDLPVLNMPALEITTEAIFTNIREHLSDFIKMFGNIKFVLVLVPIYVIFDLFKRKTALVIIFFFQGLCVLLGYALSLWWFSEIEADRYSLIPFITLGSIGLLSIKEIISSLFSKSMRK